MGKDSSDELVPGTLSMLILRTISKGGSMHGYAIANSIQEASHAVLQVDEGALYPALHRLEVRGLLRSKWGFSDNNRRAKLRPDVGPWNMKRRRGTGSQRRLRGS